MKKMLPLLASAAVLAGALAMPGQAGAQSHHGGFGGARGGVHATSVYRGGYRGWGYRGGWGHYPYFWSGVGLGLAFGYPWYDPWYYGAAYPYPYYGYYGYYGDYDVSDAPPPSGYQDPWSYDYGSGSGPPPASAPQYEDAPPRQSAPYQSAPAQSAPPAAAPGQAQPPQACGSWSWDPARSKYNWIPC